MQEDLNFCKHIEAGSGKPELNTVVRISNLLGLTPKNVSVRIARGRKMLMEILKEEYKID